MNGGMDIVVNRIPNAISIPAKALFTRDGKPIVYRRRTKDATPPSESKCWRATPTKSRSPAFQPAPWSPWSTSKRRTRRNEAPLLCHRRLSSASSAPSAGAPSACDHAPRRHCRRSNVPTTRVKKGRVTVTVAARGELQGGNSEMLTAPMVGGGDMADHRRSAQPGELVEAGDVVVQFDTTAAGVQPPGSRSRSRRSRAAGRSRPKPTAWPPPKSPHYAVLAAESDVKQAELEMRKNPILPAIVAPPERTRARSRQGPPAPGAAGPQEQKDHLRRRHRHPEGQSEQGQGDGRPRPEEHRQHDPQGQDRAATSTSSRTPT